MMGDYRLFVYGSLLSGEREHALLQDCELLGDATTLPQYRLVDLGLLAALVPGGDGRVQGELYRVDLARLAQIDVHREVPVLFQRASVALEGVGSAEAYVMRPDQVIGKRRLSSGSWRRRFEPSARPRSAWSEWARGRKS